MPPYEKSLLEETAKLTQDNNKILHSMRRAMRWGRFFTVIKLLVIVGLTLGAYYYIQPYVETLLGIYGNFNNGAPSSSSIKKGIMDSLGL